MKANVGNLMLDEGGSTRNTVYVEIKPDSYFVRRLKGEEADNVFEKNDNGELKNQNEYRVRELEMGKNKGQLIAEQLFNKLPKVQLIKAFENEAFGQRRMCLVFSDMTGDNPDVQISCSLLNARGNINGFSSSFIDKIPRIKIGDPMTISVFKFTNDEGREIRGVGVEQSGTPVKSAYYDPIKKERIGDKPIAVETVKLGKPDWDYSEVSEFQLKVFDKFCQEVNAYWGNEDEVKTTKEPVLEEEVMPF
jgi:hypothetical protein